MLQQLYLVLKHICLINSRLLVEKFLLNKHFIFHVLGEELFKKGEKKKHQNCQEIISKAHNHHVY